MEFTAKTQAGKTGRALTAVVAILAGICVLPISIGLWVGGAAVGGPAAVLSSALAMVFAFVELQRHMRYDMRKIRASARGLEVEGRMRIPANDLKRMMFVPGAGSPSKLVVRGGGGVVQIEADEPTARRMMRVLKPVDVEPATTFTGVAASRSLSARVIFATVGLWIGAAVAGAFHSEMMFNAALFVGLIAAMVAMFALIPSDIRVGVDGVTIQNRLDARFLPRATLRGATASARGVCIHTTNGDVDVPLTTRFHLTQPEIDEQRALVARVKQLVDEEAPTSRAGAWRLERSGSVETWLRALLAARTDYRSEEMSSDDLRQILASQERASTRLAAAVVLMRRGEEVDRERVRIAAEASAAPKLRIAIDAIAAGAEEDELLRLAEAVSEEEDEQERQAADLPS